MKILGYKNGFRYMADGENVYRNDYSDLESIGVRWFSSLAGFQSFVAVYGCLYDEAGNEIEQSAA